MLGIGVGLRFPSPRAAGLPPAPPSAPPLPIAASARWHPQVSQVALSDGRVVSATDLQGQAGLTASGAGPRALSDGLGRSFWRFEGDQALEAASSLSIEARAFAVFMVVRSHRCGFYNPFFSIGTATGGDATQYLTGVVSGRGAANLRALSGYPRSSVPGFEHTVVGAQMQVIGLASRGTGTGRQALFHNGYRLDVGRAAGTDIKAGAMIAHASNAGQGGNFDVYDIIVYTQELTNAQCAEITAALQAGWNIPDLEHQLVLEGDSIMQGTGLVTPALNAAMVLTEPGSGHIPANWRVTNYATSGNTVAELEIRRDWGDGGWPQQMLPGQNVVAFEIGRNDQNSFSEAVIYDRIVAYLNTAGDGILQRGWTVRAMANIAGSDPARFETRRAYLRDPQFLSDTDSGTGGAFEGKVSIISTDLIEHNGETVFLTAADAADTAYYVGDSTHPTILGAAVRVTGGDTPQYGVAWGL